MKLKIKEQLIFLKSKNVSHKVLAKYLESVMNRGQLTEELSLRECQQILLHTQGGSQSITEKNIYFNSLSSHDYKTLCGLSRQAIMIGEFYYPMLWYHTAQPPIIVFYRGNIELIRQPKISVIGTRKITQYGEQVTSQIVDEISNNHWVSVSGLALGVDARVHERSVHHPNGKTIAIIPCGLDYYYPRANQHIQRAMEAEHLILSEYLPQVKPLKHHFILRNRLVAGISKATLVIEAAQKSGSLITANYALQYNREVFALPGRINDIQSRGCNELINAGATPIQDIKSLMDDIREIFENQGF